MMKKKQSHWWRMTWIAVTIPLVGIALTAFSKPKEALKDVVDSSVEMMKQPIVEALSSDATDEVEVKETPTPAPEQKDEKEKGIKAGDKITGTVRDAANILVGANVVEIDQFNRIVTSAVTDINGNFTLKVKDPKNKIRVSFVGMQTQTLDISSDKIDVTLEEAMKFRTIQVVGRRDSINEYESRYTDYDFSSGDDNTFNVVESIPSFPGGFEELMKYLNSHLRYPEIASEMKVEAEITVKFIIDKTGLVRSPQAAEVKTSLPAEVRDLSALSDENEEIREKAKAYLEAVEALREEAVYVVRSMPRWTPGRQNGKRVDTTYTLPISFTLAK